jgi:hypothetical protein
MQDHHWYKRIGERAAKLVAGLFQLTIVSTKNEFLYWLVFETGTANDLVLYTYQKQKQKIVYCPTLRPTGQRVDLANSLI